MRAGVLATDGPLRRRRPLRAEGGGGSAQGVEGRNLDPLEDTRLATSGDDLQPVRSAPLGFGTEHRARGQDEARLYAGERDERSVQVPQTVVGLPAPIEGHAALVQGKGGIVTACA